MGQTPVKTTLTQKIVSDLEEVLGVKAPLSKTKPIEFLKTLRLKPYVRVSDDQLSLLNCLQNRRSSRNPAEFQTPFNLTDLNSLFSAVLKVRESSGSPDTYPTPVAGGCREIRLLVFIRKIEDIAPGVWEYLPECHQLNKLKADDSKINDPFYESWEFESKFTIVFCVDLARPRRAYENNLLHCAFEAGTICQSLQLYLSGIKRGSCISGYLNRNGLASVIGPNSNFPLYAISIF